MGRARGQNFSAAASLRGAPEPAPTLVPDGVWENEWELPDRQLAKLRAVRTTAGHINVVGRDEEGTVRFIVPARLSKRSSAFIAPRRGEVTASGFLGWV